MKLVFKLCVYLFVFVHIQSVFSEDLPDSEKEIIWNYSDNPPYYINSGEFAGQGVGDLILDIYIKNLKEYTHKKVFMPPLRSIDERKKGSHTCQVIEGNLPDIVAHSAMSMPSLLGKWKSGIYSKKGTYPKEYIKKGFITEDELENLKNPIAFLQIYLDYYSFYKNLNYTSLAAVPQVHKLLFSNRISSIITSSEELEYFKAIENKKEDYEFLRVFRKIDNKLVPIIDTAYTSCPNNDWGRKVIQKINGILKEQRKTKAYKDAVMRWFPLNDPDRPMLEKIYEEEFQNNELAPKS